MTGTETVTLRHVRIDLALHRLREGDGRPLLLLHGLGEATPPYPPAALDAWRGPIWGLDFTGHGASTVPVGGGYTCELLMADVDTALAHLGEVTILGRGLGAYVGVLAAGARATVVRGAILTDGPGLAGGGPSPTSPLVRPAPPAPTTPRSPDPVAFVELSRDIRPADYAATYARLALQFSGLETPLLVSAAVRPPWLDAVAAEPGVVSVPLPDALALAAAQT